MSNIMEQVMRKSETLLMQSNHLKEKSDLDDAVTIRRNNVELAEHDAFLLAKEKQIQKEHEQHVKDSLEPFESSSNYDEIQAVLVGDHDGVVRAASKRVIAGRRRSTLTTTTTTPAATALPGSEGQQQQSPGAFSPMTVSSPGGVATPSRSASVFLMDDSPDQQHQPAQQRRQSRASRSDSLSQSRSRSQSVVLEEPLGEGEDNDTFSVDAGFQRKKLGGDPRAPPPLTNWLPNSPDEGDSDDDGDLAGSGSRRQSKNGRSASTGFSGATSMLSSTAAKHAQRKLAATALMMKHLKPTTKAPSSSYAHIMSQLFMSLEENRVVSVKPKAEEKDDDTVSWGIMTKALSPTDGMRLQTHKETPKDQTNVTWTSREWTVKQALMTAILNGKIDFDFFAGLQRRYEDSHVALGYVKGLLRKKTDSMLFMERKNSALQRALRRLLEKSKDRRAHLAMLAADIRKSLKAGPSVRLSKLLGEDERKDSALEDFYGDDEDAEDQFDFFQLDTPLTVDGESTVLWSELRDALKAIEQKPSGGTAEGGRGDPLAGTPPAARQQQQQQTATTFGDHLLLGRPNPVAAGTSPQHNRSPSLSMSQSMKGGAAPLPLDISIIGADASVTGGGSSAGSPMGAAFGASPSPYRAMAGTSTPQQQQQQGGGGSQLMAANFAQLTHERLIQKLEGKILQRRKKIAVERKAESMEQCLMEAEDQLSAMNTVFKLGDKAFVRIRDVFHYLQKEHKDLLKNAFEMDDLHALELSQSKLVVCPCCRFQFDPSQPAWVYRDEILARAKAAREAQAAKLQQAQAAGGKKGGKGGQKSVVAGNDRNGAIGSAGGATGDAGLLEDAENFVSNEAIDYLVMALQDNVTELEGKLTGKDQDIASLKAELEMDQVRMRKSEERYESLRGELHEQKKRLNLIIDELEDKVDSRDAAIEQLKKSKESLKKQMDGLQRAADIAFEELREIRELEAKCESMTKFDEGTQKQGLTYEQLAKTYYRKYLQSEKQVLKLGGTPLEMVEKLSGSNFPIGLLRDVGTAVEGLAETKEAETTTGQEFEDAETCTTPRYLKYFAAETQTDPQEFVLEIPELPEHVTFESASFVDMKDALWGVLHKHQDYRGFLLDFLNRIDELYYNEKDLALKAVDDLKSELQILQEESQRKRDPTEGFEKQVGELQENLEITNDKLVKTETENKQLNAFVSVLHETDPNLARKIAAVVQGEGEEGRQQQQQFEGPWGPVPPDEGERKGAAGLGSPINTDGIDALLAGKKDFYYGKGYSIPEGMELGPDGTPIHIPSTAQSKATTQGLEGAEGTLGGLSAFSATMDSLKPRSAAEDGEEEPPSPFAQLVDELVVEDYDEGELLKRVSPEFVALPTATAPTLEALQEQEELHRKAIVLAHKAFLIPLPLLVSLVSVVQKQTKAAIGAAHKIGQKREDRIVRRIHDFTSKYSVDPSQRNPLYTSGEDEEEGAEGESNASPKQRSEGDAEKLWLSRHGSLRREQTMVEEPERQISQYDSLLDRSHKRHDGEWRALGMQTFPSLLPSKRLDDGRWDRQPRPHPVTSEPHPLSPMRTDEVEHKTSASRSGVPPHLHHKQLFLSSPRGADLAFNRAVLTRTAKSPEIPQIAPVVLKSIRTKLSLRRVEKQLEEAHRDEKVGEYHRKSSVVLLRAVKQDLADRLQAFQRRRDIMGEHRRSTTTGAQLQRDFWTKRYQQESPPPPAEEEENAEDLSSMASPPASFRKSSLFIRTLHQLGGAGRKRGVVIPQGTEADDAGAGRTLSISVTPMRKQHQQHQQHQQQQQSKKDDGHSHTPQPTRTTTNIGIGNKSPAHSAGKPKLSPLFRKSFAECGKEQGGGGGAPEGKYSVVTPRDRRRASLDHHSTTTSLAELLASPEHKHKTTEEFLAPHQHQSQHPSHHSQGYPHSHPHSHEHHHRESQRKQKEPTPSGGGGLGSVSSSSSYLLVRSQNYEEFTLQDSSFSQRLEQQLKHAKEKKEQPKKTTVYERNKIGPNWPLQ